MHSLCNGMKRSVKEHNNNYNKTGVAVVVASK